MHLIADFTDVSADVKARQLVVASSRRLKGFIRKESPSLNAGLPPADNMHYSRLV